MADDGKRPSDEKAEDSQSSNEAVHQVRPRVANMTPEEKKLALEAALAVDPGASKWGLRAMQMYWIVFIVCCCSGDTGFDTTVMGGINIMSQYQKYFGMKESGKKTSIVFGIYTIGSLCGVIPAFILPDKLGRRWSMWFGNMCIIVGALITANAHNKGMFLGGRWLTGLGTSCAGASAKSYLAEVSPPQYRGAYMGFLNSFYYIGQMTASGMMVATTKYNNDWSWRLPLYVQVVPAAINALFILLCPESPRYLHSIGKTDQARQLLAKYHSKTEDIHSPLIDLEVAEIEERVAIDGSDKVWWDIRPLFNNATARRRMWMVLMIGAFGQLSGNGLITYFLPVLIKSAGITNQTKILTLNFVNSVTSYIGALSGSFIIDRFGRRKILLVSTGTITVILIIVTALLSDTTNTNVARSNAGITFIFLFMVVFSFGWTPMQALYPAEVLSYETRAKGLAVLGIYTQAAGCINTFGLPVALEQIKWKTYLIFVVWDAFEFVIIYLFASETKELTLEEITEVFENPNPRKYADHLQQVKRRNNNVA